MVWWELTVKGDLTVARVGISYELNQVSRTLTGTGCAHTCKDAHRVCSAYRVYSLLTQTHVWFLST